MNKILKSFFGLFLGAAFSLGVAASINANKNFYSKEAEAAPSTDLKYYTGNFTSPDWSVTSPVAMSSTSNYYYFSRSFSSGNQFKIVKQGTWDDAIGWGSSVKDHTGNFGGEGGNIKCNTAGSYIVLYDGSDVHIWPSNGIDLSSTYTGWVLAGEGTAFSGGASWSPKSALQMGAGSGTDKAKLDDIIVGANDKLRIAYCYRGYRFNDDGWKNWGSTPSGFTKDGDNLKVSAAGLVNVFLNKDYVGYATYNTGYSITYNRNNGSGLTYTSDKKTPNTNYTVRTPETSPLNASGWSPTTYKRFLRWNTASDGSGTGYNAGATYSTNASLELFYIEEWYQYRYKVDSGSWITLVENNEGKGSGIKVQFSPSSAQSLPLNGKLYFQYSANGGSTWSDLTSVTFEGNYDTTTGIELSTIDTIFLKITDGNAYTCWVPGISDRTIAVFNSSSATTGGAAHSMRGNGDNETVTVEQIAIEKGQFVRRGYAGNYTYGSYFVGGAGSAASCFAQVGSDTAIECLKTGVYTVYNQKGSFDNWKDIYFTRDEAASAKYLAQQFNTIIGGVCSSISSISQLQDVWGNKSSTTLYKHFHEQVADTMSYFATSSATADTDILECVERYDYIVKKYGTTALPDFLGRKNGYSETGQQSHILISLFGQSGNLNNGILLAVVIISLGALSVGGYYFFRKSRKSEE